MQPRAAIIRLLAIAAIATGLAGAFLGGNIVSSGEARAEWFQPLGGPYPGCGYVASLGGNYCESVVTSCEAIATYRGGKLDGIKQNENSATCYLSQTTVTWENTQPFCPAGQVKVTDEVDGCAEPTRLTWCPDCGNGGEPGGTPGPSGQDGVGDPIDPINGNMATHFTDYRSAGPDVLEFTRYFASRFYIRSGLGRGWTHNYSQHLGFVGIANIYRNGPRTVGHFKNSLSRNPWLPQYKMMTGSLYEYSWGYTYTMLDGTVESYNTAGRLLSIQSRNGYTRTMSYDGAGNLIGVSDSHGRTLTFTYDSDRRMTSMTDPEGRVTAYEPAIVSLTGLGGTYEVKTLSLGKVVYPDDNDDALTAADKLSTNLDGADGSTSATDESASAHALSFAGTAQIDTAQYRFGGASALFDGTSTTYVSAPDSEDWNLGSGQFTVEASVQFSSTAAYSTPLRQFEGASNQLAWAVDYDGAGKIRFHYSTDGASYVTNAAGWTPTIGAWHHIAVDRDSSNILRLYVDGNVLIAKTVTATFYNSTANLRIGERHTGWVDEVRITKGVARYAGTWPSAASRADNPYKTYLYQDSNWRYTALTGVIDENGTQTASWEYYTSTGCCVSANEGAGGTKRIEVDFSVWPKRPVTGTLGKQYEYTISAVADWYATTKIDRLASASTPAGTRNFTYDANGWMTSSTDWNGVQTNYAYNTRGLPTSVTHAVGTPQQRTVTMAWHATLGLPTQIVAPGITNNLAYNASGLLTQVTGTDTTSHVVPYSTNGQTRTTSFTYNASGLLETVDGPLPGAGDTTSFTYDSSGYLDTVTNALGHVLQIASKDASGRPLQILDPNGVRSDIAYDARGRVISITTDATGTPRTTAIVYDAAGYVTSTTSPGGDVLTYEYDAANRLAAIVNSDGERIEYDYDLMGNVTATRVKASGGAVVRQASATYDDLGRLLKSFGAYAGEEVTLAYDAIGNVTSVTDPLANVTQYAFDSLNRLVSTTDAALGVAALAWDSSDNLDSATDQRSLSTTLVHNGFGDVIQYASPDSGTEIYEYDSAGNMTRRTDARGVVTDWTYDLLGRPTAMSFPAAPAENVTYTYDDATAGHYGIGRLAGYADESGTTDYRYDARGNILREDRTIGTQAYVSEYAWNADGLLVQKTYPSGRIVDYLRNTRGQVTEVSTRASAGAAAVTVATGITYEPFGPVKALTHGNGVAVALAYDLDGRLSAMDAFDGATPVLDLDYTYDLAGNITDIADAGGGSRGRNYAYDGLYRLTQAKELAPGGSPVTLQTDYTYDAVGNRTTRTVGGAAETYTYDPASNRLASVLAGGVTRAFTYSATGNVTLDSLGGTATTLTYNAADRLVQVSAGGVPLVDYVYAATGQRAVKTTPTATTHYLYDPGGALQAETDGAGTVLREYITLGGATIAIIDAGGMAFVHDDHLGTPQVMTDGSAAVVWDASYRPFGEASIAGAAANDQRFPGQTADAETGYSDNWHRTYDPSLGRYLQSDPVGIMAGFNTYGYVGGNPVTRVDPMGLASQGLGDCLIDCALMHYFGVSKLQIAKITSYIFAFPIYKPLIGVNPKALGGGKYFWNWFTNPISVWEHFRPGSKSPFRFLGTARLIRIIGRLNVAIAVISLMHDIYVIGNCTAKCYGCNK